MAEWVAGQAGGIWPLFAPAVGALGAFIAGSNTGSRLMFSLFQFGVAQRLLLPAAFIVALQTVGAAAGNMIAIHNVVAASATVGLLGQEGATLRKTLIPTPYYLVFVGLLGPLAVYGLELPIRCWRLQPRVSRARQPSSIEWARRRVRRSVSSRGESSRSAA